jgi:predicted  nucleic acid-binding Zn-ribbon protein
VVERPVSQGLALLDTDLNTVSVYANRREIPERLRAALQEIVRRRRLVQEREAQAAAREAEINAIGQDQDRVRKNMAALDKGSALYKRYVAQLDAQETRLQTLRSDARRLRREAADAAQDLRAYLDNLDVADR